jgi:hypothetical protein
MAFNFDFGQALNSVLDKGLDIWVDTEKSKNYQPGAQTVGQRDAAGGTGQAGQPAASVMLPQWANNPAVMVGGAVILLLLVIVLAKKL